MGVVLSVLNRIYSLICGSKTSQGKKYALVKRDSSQRSKSSSSSTTNTKLAEKPKTHSACRSTNPNQLTPYQSKIDNHANREIIFRTYVPDDKVDWSVDWPDYLPNEFTASKLIDDQPVWADGPDPLEITNWNKLDGQIDRRSHMGEYQIIDGVPRNPVGRTGIRGRGQLGKWGVNHAADPIVTRWKRDDKGKKVVHPESKKPILQFVSIRRLDTNAWAIPGGMCDPGEKISQTLKREFMEEATDCLGSNQENRERIEQHLNAFFEKGTEIYRGYVDDPRNTDNSWMETIAYNFHDKDDKVFKEFTLTAGDDAGSVTWMDLDGQLKLYASHKEFVKKAAELHKAHW